MGIRFSNMKLFIPITFVLFKLSSCFKIVEQDASPSEAGIEEDFQIKFPMKFCEEQNSRCERHYFVGDILYQGCTDTIQGLERSWKCATEIDPVSYQATRLSDCCKRHETTTGNIRHKCTANEKFVYEPGYNITNCVFPFEYLDREYHECTTADWTRAWCGTSVNSTKPGSFSWGQCNSQCRGYVEPESKICRTKEDNHVCQFPFKYKGRVYDKCTYTEHHALWCATSVNAYGELIYWGNCDEESCLDDGEGESSEEVEVETTTEKEEWQTDFEENFGPVADIREKGAKSMF